LEFLNRPLNAFAEEVVVCKEVAAEFLSQGGGGFDEAGIALPGLRVE
jgi:hypothetical protein